MRIFVHPDTRKRVSDSAQIWNNIDADIEEGVIKTARELLANYSQHKNRVMSRLGYGVNSGRWQIKGVWPNNNSDKKSGSLNRKLGEEILREHADKVIRAVGKFERKCVLQTPK
jgi:hypothetical protein